MSGEQLVFVLVGALIHRAMLEHEASDHSNVRVDRSSLELYRQPLLMLARDREVAAVPTR